MRRQLNGKSRPEMLHISEVLRDRIIPVSVAEHLDFRCQAANFDSVNTTPAIKPLCRIDPIFAVFHPIYAVPSIIEHNCMHIDL